jgi:hypoxanthine-guanine phosphoribosyltransferase
VFDLKPNYKSIKENDLQKLARLLFYVQGSVWFGGKLICELDLDVVVQKFTFSSRSIEKE